MYCRGGRRSAIAAAELNGMAYKDIKNLRGGILEWKYDLIMDQNTENNKTLKQEESK